MRTYFTDQHPRVKVAEYKAKAEKIGIEVRDAQIYPTLPIREQEPFKVDAILSLPPELGISDIKPVLLFGMPGSENAPWQEILMEPAGTLKDGRYLYRGFPIPTMEGKQGFIIKVEPSDSTLRNEMADKDFRWSHPGSYVSFSVLPAEITSPADSLIAAAL